MLGPTTTPVLLPNKGGLRRGFLTVRALQRHLHAPQHSVTFKAQLCHANQLDVPAYALGLNGVEEPHNLEH